MKTGEPRTYRLSSIEINRDENLLFCRLGFQVKTETTESCKRGKVIRVYTEMGREEKRGKEKR